MRESEGVRNESIAIPVALIRNVLALIALALVVAVVAVNRDRLPIASDPVSQAIDRSSYQAVFLTTSQVYFGRLTIDGDAYLLADVYYIENPPQGETKGTLVKRGNELQGPKEPMVILKSQVVFFENMRDDSEVMSAIRLYKSGAQPAPVATPAPVTNPTATPRPSASR